MPTPSKNTPCPIRGHTHTLPLEAHPERPDLVVARCGDRIVYQASVNEHLTDAGYLESYTVSELKNLPEWDDVKSPKPYTKDGIIRAILEIRNSPRSFEYKVPDYKE